MIWIYGRHPFLTFPSPANQKKRWMDLIRLYNFVPGRFSSLCSSYLFIDKEPTVLHPYPELFAYNNYKEINDQRGKASILTQENITFTPHEPSSDTNDEIEEDANKQSTSRSYLTGVNRSQ